MNDFTKEELTILEDCMIIAIDGYECSDPIFKLKDKLQSMIESYDVSDTNVVDKLTEYLNFMMKNQLELRTEHDGILPPWNLGYMEAILENTEIEVPRPQSLDPDFKCELYAERVR